MLFNNKQAAFFSLVFILFAPVAIAQTIDPQQRHEAITTIEALIQQSPNDPVLQTIREIVVNSATPAVTVKSPDKQIVDYNNRAIEQANQGNYQAAIDLLEKALTVDIATATIHQNLTTLYTYLASQAYRQALDSDTKIKPPTLEGLATTQTD